MYCLCSHGEILGVLEVFTRSRFCAEALGSLRVIADHAAAAIATAPAFHGNICLREELELEILERDDVEIEFDPEPLGGGRTQHRMSLIPDGIRVEFIAPAA